MTGLVARSTVAPPPLLAELVKPSKSAIVKLPALKMRRSPESALENARNSSAVRSSFPSPSPIPLPARNATWSAVMFAPSPVRLSTIAPALSLKLPSTPL